MRTRGLVVVLTIMAMLVAMAAFSGCKPKMETDETIMDATPVMEDTAQAAVDDADDEEATDDEEEGDETDEEATDDEEEASDEGDEEEEETAEADDDGWVKLDGGLKINDEKVGDGKEAKKGDTVFVHYVGTLADGTKFDASRAHGDKPIDFPIGVGGVIDGWDEGIPGMKVGGTRKLIIPADLAYGSAGRPGIPPDSELHFTVELCDIQ